MDNELSPASDSMSDDKPKLTDEQFAEISALRAEMNKNKATGYDYLRQINQCNQIIQQAEAAKIQVDELQAIFGKNEAEVQASENNLKSKLLEFLNDLGLQEKQVMIVDSSPHYIVDYIADSAVQVGTNA